MRTLRPLATPITSDIALTEVIKEAILHVETAGKDQHIVRRNTGPEYEHRFSDQCCSCDPVVIYTDLITGYRVYLHRTFEA